MGKVVEAFQDAALPIDLTGLEIVFLTDSSQPVQPNPFYERNAVLTPEIVKNVIDGLEGIFVFELQKYPGYHRNAQGISADEYLVPPGFDKLPPAQQLAVVQGIDRIAQELRVPDVEPEPAPSPPAEPASPRDAEYVCGY